MYSPMSPRIVKGNNIMSISRSLLQLSLVTCLGGLLIACEGSNTVANPNLSTGDLGYTGPPARTPDIRSFQQNFWTFLKEDNRCGQCHTAGGQPRWFADKTDVNAAYSKAIQIVSLLDPGSSAIVAKAATGHNCWLGQAAGQACADNIEQMIFNWANDSNVTSARLIQLSPPAINNPGDARSFPLFTDPTGAAFATTVHPILVDNCQNCHEETATPLPISPFFANGDAASAYEAAKPKMDIDTPAISRLVVRLRQEAHNCWTNCADDANTMQTAITNFANGISIDPINTSWKTSKALNLSDGIAAAGGNRHESNLVALWEFRTGSGNEAFDTSGIDPSITLQIQGPPVWLGNYGLDLTNIYASANNFDSVKLKTFIEATGEYAIEAWVIPANVTQQNANIVGYSGGAARNFTLGQEMYNYEMYNRIDDPDPQSLNGEPFLTTGDSNEELLQSSLQHVVANYDPLVGRSIYINGNLVENPATPGVSLDRKAPPTSIGNVVWDDNFAFVLGADVGGNNNWDGQLRMVAIHNRTLTPAQVQQNFDVGVGETFYMLFFVGHHWGEPITDPKSFILFEVSQFDSYGYLFEAPRFINLDPAWLPPTGITLKGMRIGINGKVAVAGQAYANINTTINARDFQLGQQVLSTLGTVIALEKSAATDEFFLTFEDIGGQTFTFPDPKPAAPPSPFVPTLPVVSDIGMRTFEEISATIATITGIPVNDDQTFIINGNIIPTASVKDTYDSYIQQLPTVESIDAFLPSHQMAIAQLALASCNTLVETNLGYFGANNFLQAVPMPVAQDAFGPPPAATYYVPAQPTGAPSVAQDANRNLIVDTLLTAAINVDQADSSKNLTSQPDAAEVSGLLGSGATQDLDPAIIVALPSEDDYESLISEMLGCKLPQLPAAQECTPINTAARTKQIVKAVCAAAVGSAAMLVQ
jgi:hypothetical protein